MGWVRKARKALEAGQEIQIRPTGAHLYPYFESDDLLTLAPVDPTTLQRRDVLFHHWKGNSILRQVLEVREGEVLTGIDLHCEGTPVPLEDLLGRVIRVDKNYSHRDPLDPTLCYDYLLSGYPMAEAWGDCRHGTFHLYAKSGFWEFILSPTPHYCAADFFFLVNYDFDTRQASEDPLPEETVEAAKRCFTLSGDYDDELPGAVEHHLSEEGVMQTIRDCIMKYERELTAEPART